MLCLLLYFSENDYCAPKTVTLLVIGYHDINFLLYYIYIYIINSDKQYYSHFTTTLFHSLFNGSMAK